MDQKTTALLVKIVALFDSPNDGERDNAFAKAHNLLEKQGQGEANVLQLLTMLGVRVSVMAAFMDWVQGRKSAAKAVDQAEPAQSEGHSHTAQRQDQAESRAKVIARYGSVQAALQPCEREALLRRSARHGSTFHAPPNERWTSSLYGYMPAQPDGPTRDRAVRAMARAYPLPTNFDDALAEHVYWEKRDRELQLVLGGGGNGSRLDLTAHLRWELIRNLIRSELPVHGKADFQIRLQFWIDERQEELERFTRDEVMRLAETVGRDLGSVAVRNSDATTVLFAQWVCDVVVPALPLPGRGRTGSNRTFDALLRDAMRAALTDVELQHLGQAREPVARPSTPMGH